MTVNDPDCDVTTIWHFKTKIKLTKNGNNNVNISDLINENNVSDDVVWPLK